MKGAGVVIVVLMGRENGRYNSLELELRIQGLVVASSSK